MLTARRLAVAAIVATLALSLAPGVATAASPQVTGTVTDADGDPVGGVCVDFHESLQSFSRVTTSGDGTFVASPGSGTYRVRFHACDSGADVAATWFQASRGHDEATPVSVDAGAASAVVLNMQLADGAAITGVARPSSDGGTVPGACINVTDPTDASVKGSTVASADGSFSVGGLPAGVYVLKASDCGPAPVERATVFWGEDGAVARGPDDAGRIAVTAGTDSAIGSVVMPAAGTVNGFVVDNVGTPDFAGVPDACVTVIDLDSNTSLGTTTGAIGEYEIAGILPGNYLIRVADCQEPDPEARFGTVYLLPDGGATADPAVAIADPFVIGAGVTAVGSREVFPGGAVSGVVSEAADAEALRTSAAAGDPVAGACVAAIPAGSLRIAASTVTAADGSYVIGGLSTTQSYRVAAFDCGSVDRFGLQWSVGSLTPGQALPISVNAGDTTTNRPVHVGNVIRRAAGLNRIGTSVDLALGTFDEADTVVLARHDEYPDALAGAPLAASLDAPIMLTPTGGLDASVAAAINALGATRVVLLGGEAALSGAVAAQVDALPAVSQVDRINGTTRFDTAARIGALLPATHAYVVEGINENAARGWPDAVSVAGLAAIQERPLLLVARDSVPSSTAGALASLPLERLTIIGGPAAVSDDVAAQLAGTGVTVDRVFGLDRYDTSSAVVELSLENGAWSRTGWIATGRNYPDALVAGAAVGQDGGFLQLVPGDDLTRSADAVATIADLAGGIDRLVLLGGDAAVSDTTEAQLATLLGQTG